MTQIKKRKNGRSVLEKRLFSKTFFTSVLTIARKMPKTKRKNPDKMLVNLSENIPTITQTIS